MGLISVLSTLTNDRLIKDENKSKSQLNLETQCDLKWAIIMNIKSNILKHNYEENFKSCVNNGYILIGHAIKIHTGRYG